MTRRKSAQNTRNCTMRRFFGLWLSHYDCDSDCGSDSDSGSGSGSGSDSGLTTWLGQPAKVDNMWIFLVTFEFI